MLLWWDVAIFRSYSSQNCNKKQDQVFIIFVTGLAELSDASFSRPTDLTLSSRSRPSYSSCYQVWQIYRIVNIIMTIIVIINQPHHDHQPSSSTWQWQSSSPTSSWPSWSRWSDNWEGPTQLGISEAIVLPVIFYLAWQVLNFFESSWLAGTLQTSLNHH